MVLPLRADGEVKLEDERSHLSVQFALERAQNTHVEFTGGIALYQGALDGSDVVHRVHAEGTEDYVVFEARPAREELSYAVDVSRVPGLRLVSNTLEFLDESGTPLLRVAPPYVMDSGHRRHEAKLAVAGCAYDTSPAGPWGRKVTNPGAARCSVRVTWAGDIAYPAMVDPAWTATGSMVTTRNQGHSVSVLPSGKVLIAGGAAGSVLASAELFDPTGSGTFAATGSMASARRAHTATVLASGKVLIAGGYGGVFLASAELYDPAGNAGAGTFAATGSMADPRMDHTASVLPSGKVLVAGGNNNTAVDYLASAEIFDPAGNAGAGSFTSTAAMAATRSTHTASVLLSGKVLVAGGHGTANMKSAEIFDPAGNGGVGTFAATADLVTARADFAASVLPSGKVLLTGGLSSSLYLRSAELFDPAGNAGAGTFTTTGSMTVARASHTASILPSGSVLVAGGFVSTGTPTASAERFDPAGNGGAGTFTATVGLVGARANHAASVLASGRILVAAGVGSGKAAEVYGGALGDACTANGYCFSGFCANGFCCNAACTQGCDRCDLAGREGACNVAPVAAPGASPACAFPLACDGVNAACPTSCVSDAACATTHYCAPDGTCVARKAQAAACNTQANCKAPGCRECASGFCVDGFCCDTACSGTCLACAATSKQSGRDDGSCGPTKIGIDLRNQCSPDGTPCGVDGQCNGTGACALVTPAGVSCAPDGKVCDGSGACVLPAILCDGDHTITAPDGKKQDCAPFKCDSNGTCQVACTSVSDCVAPTICDATGKCVAPSAADGGGCSVVAAKPDVGWQVTWLAAAAGLLFVRRRRER